MSQIRVNLIILTLWFVFLSQISIFLPGHQNLELFTYGYLAFMAVSIFLFPAVGRQSLFLSTLVAQFLYVFNYLFWGAILGIGETLLFAVGIMMVQATLMIMRWAIAPLIEFDHAAQNLILSDNSNILSYLKGEEQINHELYRARRFERPFSIVYCQLPEAIEADPEDVAHIGPVTLRITKHFKQRYQQIQLMKYVNSVIYKSDIVAEYQNGIVIGLPETNREDALTFVNRLGSLIKDNMQISPFVGISTFPENGLICEHLVSMAAQDSKSWGDDQGVVPDDTIGGRQGELMVDPKERLRIEQATEWMNYMSTPSMASRKTYTVVKRGMDIAFVMILLPLILPVMALIALLIYMEDGDNIFYTQWRTGRGGKRFQMYKFRSMHNGVKSVPPTQVVMTDGSVRYVWPEKVENDPRITRIGRFIRKTSLDELPQLLNVLKGDMSLVGPRPTSWDLDKYTSHQTERLSVQPGLTGLWQVSARETPNFDERLVWDMKYIEKYSIWLDLQILFRTATQVFKKAGV